MTPSICYFVLIDGTHNIPRRTSYSIKSISGFDQLPSGSPVRDWVSHHWYPPATCQHTSTSIYFRSKQLSSTDLVGVNFESILSMNNIAAVLSNVLSSYPPTLSNPIIRIVWILTSVLKKAQLVSPALITPTISSLTFQITLYVVAISLFGVFRFCNY